MVVAAIPQHYRPTFISVPHNRAGLARAIPALAELVANGELERMLHCVEAATHESDKAPPERGGVGGLWSMMKDPENQRSLRFLMILAKQMRETCVQR